MSFNNGIFSVDQLSDPSKYLDAELLCALDGISLERYSYPAAEKRAFVIPLEVQDQIRANLDFWKERAEKIIEENKNASRDLASKEISALHVIHHKQKQLLKDRIVELEKLEAQSQATLKGSQQQIAELENSKTQLQEIINANLQQIIELEISKAELQATPKANQQQIVELKKSKTQLQEILKEKQQKIASLNGHISDLEYSEAQLQNSYKQEIASLSICNSGLEKSKAKLGVELNRCQQQLKAFKARLKSKDSLQDLKESEERAKLLDENNSILRITNSGLKKGLKKLSSQNSSLTLDLDKLKQNLAKEKENTDWYKRACVIMLVVSSVLLCINIIPAWYSFRNE